MSNEKKDEYGLILDYLPRGRASDMKDEPIALVVGTKYFSLLEVVLRKGVKVELGDKVYIGEGKRDKVKYIKKSVEILDLTGTAKEELEDRLDDLIEENEKKFVKFFNNAGPLTPRMHQLETLPGVGKKHMWEIIDERKEGDFESLDDIKERLPSLTSPEKIIKRKIKEELDGESKHNIFTIPKK